MYIGELAGKKIKVKFGLRSAEDEEPPNPLLEEEDGKYDCDLVASQDFKPNRMSLFASWSARDGNGKREGSGLLLAFDGRARLPQKFRANVSIIH